MTKQIRYSETVWSVAGNKSPYQSGMQVEKIASLDKICLQAINPKTNRITTHLQLQIPIGSVPDLIQALQELL